MSVSNRHDGIEFVRQCSKQSADEGGMEERQIDARHEDHVCAIADRDQPRFETTQWSLVGDGIVDTLDSAG